MDPSKTQDDLSRDSSQDNSHRATAHDDLADSLDRLSLANAAAIPLPTSPSLSTHETSSRPPNQQPTPRRIPSSNSLLDDRRKSTPTLQKRQSTASLRTAAGNNPSSPGDSSGPSSGNFAGSPTSAATPAMAPRVTSAPKGPTAALIAAKHFEEELDLHKSAHLGSKTVVVIHDDCYRHRFSRPGSNKKVLDSIVERPERIRACVAGVAAAYVRLGLRYAGERYAPHPDIDFAQFAHLPPPFQIIKSSRSLPLTDESVTSVHGTSWMNELKGMCDSAESRLASEENELVRSRTQNTEGILSSGPELSSGDLYLCSESANAFQGALGGVCDGIDFVLGPSPTTRAFVCIRPPGHHCSTDFPSGFCWINNVHVGISYAANMHGLTHAAILDFDLHHGDGSQEIAWNHNTNAWRFFNPDEPARNSSSAYEQALIGYYSLHDINSYPCEDGDPVKIRNASVCLDAQGQSITNVHLENWETEAQFWNLYHDKYMVLIKKARVFLRRHTERLLENPNGPPPKAAIFISAGFDASEWECSNMQRHKVHVPTEFYARFTADVVQMSQEDGLGVDGRVISVLEGGYSDRALTSGVLSHLAGLGSMSQEPFLRPPVVPSTDFQRVTNPEEACRVDVSWWSPTQLEELERLLRSRARPKSTFSKSTRASSAKAVTSARDRARLGSSPGFDPSLPPPDVSWATAAHELSKILIPESRETKSYRPDDLRIDNVRARYADNSRARYAQGMSLDGAGDSILLPPPIPVDDKRQLRIRKTKSPTPYSPRPATPRQQAMRKNRRKTVDGNDLPDASQEGSPSVDASRRKSATGVAPVAIGDTSGAKDRDLTPDDPAPSASSNSDGTRKTSGSRQGTPRRAASPRKQPPVPKVPSTFLPSRLSDEVPLPQDDEETMTSGLRKVKLVMPSPEEQAAREKKIADESKQAAKATRAPKSPKPRKTSGPKISRGQSTSRSENPSITSPPAVPPIPLGAYPNEATVKQESQPFNFGLPTQTRTVSASNPNALDTMFTAKPSEYATPLVSPSIGQQPGLPLNKNSPHTPDNNIKDMDMSSPPSHVFSPPTSEAQTKTGLPVFTSSSAIPFSAPGIFNDHQPPKDTHSTQDHHN